MRKLLLFTFILFQCCAMLQASPKEISSVTLSFTSQISTQRNYFDLQSYGTPLQIWQNPLDPQILHAVYTMSSQSSGFNDRFVAYYKTTNFGVNWSFDNITLDSVSDFGTISGFSTGEVLIAMNSYGSGVKRTGIYNELFAGSGIFYSTYTQGESNKYLYPRIAPIVHHPGFSYLLLTSSNNMDSSFYLLQNDSPGLKKFKPFNARTEESYSIIRKLDYTIGIAYVAKTGSSVENYGDVYYMQSNDDGNTFTAPLKIFDANFAGDSLGGFKGISLSFAGADPKLVFETVKQRTDGSYFPEAPSKIRFWSTSLPGNDPNRSIVIADSSNIQYAPAKGTLDFEAPLCRPSIGVSGNIITCVFNSQTSRLGGTDNTSYNAIYIMQSIDGGLNWKSPIGGQSTYDFTFPSLVPISPPRRSGLMTIYDAHFIYQRDIVPGSNVVTNNPNTNANAIYHRQMYYQYDAPILTSPANNATNVSLTPTFIWFSGSEYYTLQISTSSDFTAIIHQNSGSLSAQYTLPSGILNLQTRYYWRVIGESQGIAGQWSIPFSFVTGASGIVKEPGDIPTEYRLYSNYPNPFNPQTKIKYDLPANGYVSLKVFDMSGKEIESLINQVQNAGSYSVDFNAASLPSGIYFYKLVTEKFSETRKMILIK